MVERVNTGTGEATFQNPGTQPAEGDQPGTTEGAQPASPERPDWLPEKFKTPEDLAKAYGALESKLGALPSERGADEPPPEGTEGDTPPEPGQAQRAVEGAGLDFQAMSQEFAESGELSEGTYESLEKAGFPKEMVDQYIQGQQALADRFQNEVFTSVGGEDAYKNIVAWGVENMTEAEMDAYDSAMNSGNQEQIKLAVRGLADRYRGAVGEPSLVTGKTGAGAVGDVYTNWADVRLDMADPRYAESPDYRARVEQKIARSPNL